MSNSVDLTKHPHELALIPPSAPEALALYGITAEQIQLKREEYEALTFDTATGYELGVQGIHELVGMRVAVDKRRKALNADKLEEIRQTNADAKAIIELIESIEAPLKLKRAAVDSEKARLKALKAEAERAELEAKLAAERAVEDARLAAEREAERQRMNEERARIARERSAFEQEQREAARVRAVEEAKLKAEQAELAEQRRQLEQAKAEEQLRVENERRAAAKAERERLEAEELVQANAEQEQRLANLQPDILKIAQLAALIRSVPIPVCHIEHSARIVEAASKQLGRAAAALEGFVATMAGQS